MSNNPDDQPLVPRDLPPEVFTPGPEPDNLFADGTIDFNMKSRPLAAEDQLNFEPEGGLPTAPSDLPSDVFRAGGEKRVSQFEVIEEETIVLIAPAKKHWWQRRQKTPTAKNSTLATISQEQYDLEKAQYDQQVEQYDLEKAQYKRQVEQYEREQVQYEQQVAQQQAAQQAEQQVAQQQAERQQAERQQAEQQVAQQQAAQQQAERQQAEQQVAQQQAAQQQAAQQQAAQQAEQQAAQQQASEGAAAQYEIELAQYNQQVEQYEIELAQYNQQMEQYEIELAQYNQQVADQKLTDELEQESIKQAAQEASTEEVSESSVQHDRELAQYNQQVEQYERELAQYNQQMAAHGSSPLSPPNEQVSSAAPVETPDEVIPVVTSPQVVSIASEDDATKKDQRRRQHRIKKEAARRRKEARKEARRGKSKTLGGIFSRNRSNKGGERIGSDSVVDPGPVPQVDYLAPATPEKSERDLIIEKELLEAEQARKTMREREELRATRQKEAEEEERNKEKEESISPPRRFLMKIMRQHGDLIGLDIGSRHIRAAHMKDGQLVLLASRALPSGIFEDGILIEPEIFSRELSILWKEASIPSKRINFSVLNRQVAMRILELRAEEREDLQMAISMNADNVLAPISTKTATIDYAELSRSASGVSVQLAAAEKPMVRSIVRASERSPSRLLASGCEISILAASRALRLPRHSKSAHMLLDIGAQTTGVVCLSGRDVFFLRVLEIGGDDFTKAIALALGCDEKRAEDIKIMVGLDGQAGDISAEERALAQQAVLSISDQLCGAIAKTREFYNKQPGGKPVEAMTLIGGGARLQGLRNQLKLFSGVSEILDPTPMPNVSSVKEIDIYATAIGLADDQNMSLLPETDARNFAAALPGLRRSSKISNKEHKERVKEAGIGVAKTKKISPKTLSILAAVLAFGFCYWLGAVHFASQNKALEPGVASKQEAYHLAEIAPQTPVYSQTAEVPVPQAYAPSLRSLRQTPNLLVLGQALAVVSQSGASEINSQNISDDTLNFTGVVEKEETLRSLQLQLEAIPGLYFIEEVKKTSIKDGQQGFSFSIQAPTWRQTK